MLFRKFLILLILVFIVFPIHDAFSQKIEMSIDTNKLQAGTKKNVVWKVSHISGETLVSPAYYWNGAAVELNTPNLSAGNYVTHTVEVDATGKSAGDTIKAVAKLTAMTEDSWNYYKKEHEFQFEVYEVPKLVETGISPPNSSTHQSSATATLNGKFRAWYKIDNPGVSRTVWLGLSIRSPEGEIFSDSSSDKSVTISSGEYWENRDFNIPSDISTGEYDVIFAIWPDHFESSSWDRGEMSDCLTIVDHFTLELSSKTTDGEHTDVGKIEFEGTKYDLPASIQTENVSSVGVIMYPLAGYVYDSWETSGEISISDFGDGTASISLTGDATLTAVFKKAPSFDISVSPDDLGVTRGGSTSADVTVTSKNGFEGNVDFTIMLTSGAPWPPWISADFNPDSVSVSANSSASSALTISVTDDAPIDTHDLTVWGTNDSLRKSYNIDLMVSGRPDLVITELSWSPAPVYTGDKVAFKYTEKNQGNADSGDFGNALYIDEERVDISALASLSAGESKEREFTYQWTAKGGSHEITVKADWKDEIDESSEKNNSKTRDLDVKSQPNLTVRVSNIPEHDLPDAGGTIRGVLYHSDYTVVKEKSITFTGGESHNDLDFGSMPNGDYIVEVYQTPSTGLQIEEFWGSNSFTLSESKTYEFQHHTQVTWNIEPLNETYISGDTITPKETVKNFETYDKKSTVRLIYDRDKQAPWDYDETSSIATIPKDDTHRFTLPSYTPNEEGIYYTYAITYGNYADDYQETDQWIWIYAFDVFGPKEITDFNIECRDEWKDTEVDFLIDGVSAADSKCDGSTIRHSLMSAAGVFDYHSIASFNRVNIVLPESSIERDGRYRVKIKGTIDALEWDLAYSVLTGAGFSGGKVILGWGDKLASPYESSPDAWNAADQAVWKSIDIIKTYAAPEGKVAELLKLLEYLGELKELGELLPSVDESIKFEISDEFELTSGESPRLPFVATAFTLVNALGLQMQASVFRTDIHINKLVLEGPITQSDTPAITVTPTDEIVSFDDCPVGETTTQSFTAKNVGGGVLDGSVITPEGFEVLSNGAYSLKAGESIDVEIAFQPGEVRIYEGNILFSGGESAKRQVKGKGFSPQGVLQVLPEGTVDFGDVVVEHEISSKLKIANIGQNSIQGVITGLASPFSLEGGNSYELKAGEIKEIIIRFKPSSVSSYSDIATFTGGMDNVSRKLKGEGLKPPSEEIIDAKIVDSDFASGTFSPGQNVTSRVKIKNTGNISHDFTLQHKIVHSSGTSVLCDYFAGPIPREPGQGENIWQHLDCEIPDDALTGEYDIYISVWNKDINEKFDGVRAEKEITIEDGKAIILTSPNGGEVWRGGSSHNIMWESSESEIDHVRLLYSTDSGNTYPNTIIASTQDDGTHPWTTPEINSAKVRVKAEAYDASNNALTEDESDNDFIIDSTPPETTITLSGTGGDNSWYTSDVEVELSATDNLSGVRKTEYKINDNPWKAYSSEFTVSDEGTTTVYYYSEDNAGNIEEEKSQEIKIDKSDKVFVVTGKVTKHDGKDAKTGLKVIVKNRTRPSLPFCETTVGKQEPGEYRVVFMEIDTQEGTVATVADVDDIIEVEIRDTNDSQLQNKKRKVTQADIDAARAIVNIQLPKQEEQPGDVSGNGRVTAYDTALILQHISGLIELSEEQQGRADVDGQEGISTNDARLILQRVVGVIDKFPVEEGN